MYIKVKTTGEHVQTLVEMTTRLVETTGKQLFN